MRRVIMLAAVLSLGMLAPPDASRQNVNAQTKARQAMPADSPALATDFGKLVRVERSNKVMVRTIKPTGSRNEIREAEAGKTFVILHFVGKSKVDLGAGPERELMMFLARVGGAMVRTDSHSWLIDASGKKYEQAFVISTPQKRHLAFEVPTEAAGLVWNDGKGKFRLEPTPAAIIEPKPEDKKQP